jgi:choline transport protein
MALMATYSLSIGCVLWQRTVNRGVNLPHARWSLGRFGVPVNAIAFIYSLFVFFWTGWPGAPDPTVQTFNWSPVMFGGVFVLSLFYYLVRGRKTYKGPVSLVRSGTGVQSRGGSF